MSRAAVLAYAVLLAGLAALAYVAGVALKPPACSVPDQGVRPPQVPVTVPAPAPGAPVTVPR